MILFILHLVVFFFFLGWKKRVDSDWLVVVCKKRETILIKSIKTYSLMKGSVKWIIWHEVF